MAKPVAEILADTLLQTSAVVLNRCDEDALAAPGPVIARALIEPNKPPMPKITLEQTKKFAQSLIRGTPPCRKIARTVLGDKIREPM